MHMLGEVYHWTDFVLRYAFIVLHVWAVLDCLVRKAAAFPAADKLTKLAWLAILVFAGVLGTFIPPTVGPVSLIAIVVVAIYLADVRPAVRDIVSEN